MDNVLGLQVEDHWTSANSIFLFFGLDSSDGLGSMYFGCI